MNTLLSPGKPGSHGLLAGAGLFLIALSEVQAANLLINGDFSARLDGWQDTGTVFDTGQAAVLSDASGLRRSAVFQTASAPAGSVTLRLSFDLLTSLSPAVGLGQTPDSFFISAFFGAAPFGPDLDTAVFDTAAAVLDADYRGTANAAPGLTAGLSPRGAGWTRYSLTLAATPYATVAFELIDGNGVAGDSTGAVDNVVLDAVLVPEPRGIAMIAAGWLLSPRRRLRGSNPRRITGVLPSSHSPAP